MLKKYFEHKVKQLINDFCDHVDLDKNGVMDKEQVFASLRKIKGNLMGLQASMNIPVLVKGVQLVAEGMQLILSAVDKEKAAVSLVALKSDLLELAAFVKACFPKAAVEAEPEVSG